MVGKGREDVCLSSRCWETREVNVAGVGGRNGAAIREIDGDGCDCGLLIGARGIGHDVVTSGATINDSQCLGFARLRETSVTVISCASVYTSANSIACCPLPSVALPSRRASHEVVLVGFFLVTVPWSFAVLAVVLISNSKSVCPTITASGAALVDVGVARLLILYQVFEGCDVAKGCLELLCEVCVGSDQLAESLLVGCLCGC